MTGGHLEIKQILTSGTKYLEKSNRAVESMMPAVTSLGNPLRLLREA